MPAVTSRPRTYRCTGEEQAEIVERARAAAMPVSRYLVACALREDDPPAGSAPATAAAEQRELLAVVRRLDASLRALDEPVPGAGWSMLEALALLLRVHRRHGRRGGSPGA